MAISASSSCSQCGSLKDTLTCLASFLVSSSPGTVESSIHKLGVSHILALHMTHSAESETAGSSGVFSPLLSNVSGDPHRKEATAGFSSTGSPRSASPPSNPSLPNGILGLADWLGAHSSTKLTWHCLFFCPSLHLW